MLKIRCRLNILLAEREKTLDELASASGLPANRIAEYCDENIDAVSMKEVGAILGALGVAELSDFFEMEFIEEEQGEETLIYEDDWETPCAASPDGKHNWYRDVTASSSVYQEYFCSACKHRFAFIL